LILICIVIVRLVQHIGVGQRVRLVRGERGIRTVECTRTIVQGIVRVIIGICVRIGVRTVVVVVVGIVIAVGVIGGIVVVDVVVSVTGVWIQEVRHRWIA
jgi:hypothetical protein